MVEIGNIQQLLDDHIFAALQSAWGQEASGPNWEPTAAAIDNAKNRYAITREYRTVQPAEVEEMVKGLTNARLGCIILGNTRLLNTPLDIMGKKYGVRYETSLYCCAMNYRQSQIGGNRVSYLMNSNVIQALINAPFTINRVSVPFVVQSFDTEFASTEMDSQRIIAIIPTSTIR